MAAPITIEWDGDAVSRVVLAPSWREDRGRIADEVMTQFNEAYRAHLTPNPRFGSALGLSMDELRVLRHLLDDYNDAVAKRAEVPPQLVPGEAYHEPPIVAHYANNRIFNLEIPNEWLESAAGQAVTDKLERLLTRLPRTTHQPIDDEQSRARAALENFWGGHRS